MKAQHTANGMYLNNSLMMVRTSNFLCHIFWGMCHKQKHAVIKNTKKTIMPTTGCSQSKTQRTQDRIGKKRPKRFGLMNPQQHRKIDRKQLDV